LGLIGLDLHKGQATTSQQTKTSKFGANDLQSEGFIYARVSWICGRKNSLEMKSSFTVMNAMQIRNDHWRPVVLAWRLRRTHSTSLISLRGRVAAMQQQRPFYRSLSKSIKMLPFSYVWLRYLSLLCRRSRATSLIGWSVQACAAA